MGSDTVFEQPPVPLVATDTLGPAVPVEALGPVPVELDVDVAPPLPSGSWNRMKQPLLEAAKSAQAMATREVMREG